MKKRFRLLILVVALMLEVMCLAGCGSQEPLPKESAELFKQKVVRTDSGEFYVPIEHLLIMKDDNNVFFAIYESSSDKFVYDVLSYTVITFDNSKMTVKKALAKDYVWIRQSATEIYTLSMIPELITKITELEDGKFYIKMSDLESVRALLQEK